MKAYLAGPDVFRADAAAIGARKKAACRAYGIEPLYPFDQALEGFAPGAVSPAIFAGNIAMMRAADVVIANLTPFRSPSADPGTAFELGFMFALGKPVFGYSEHALPLFERMTDGVGREALVVLADGRSLHFDGLVVEDFDLHDNLMLIEAIMASGGSLHTAADAADPFEACLAAASRLPG
ncbi:nucleoside 2-deoxyribosyltransferase, partial [Hansschlegelia zhihuaiae]